MRYHSGEWRKIDWFPESHEILTSSEDVAAYPPFKNYIDMVKSGKQETSQDIKDLIKIIEKHLYPMIDDGNVYMDLTLCEDFRLIPDKAFPYSLFTWEEYLLPYICGFRFSEDDVLVFNEYFLYMARGAGKNGFMSWLIYALISKINGIDGYDVAVSASSERQAKTSFLDVHGVLTKTDPDKRAFKRSLTEIQSLSTKSKFSYLSSNGKTADGLRLGAMYLDEIHAIEDYAMMKVLRSSLGKIPDARMLITTTDGYVRGAVLDGYKDKSHSILNEERGFWFPRDDRRFSSLLPFMHHIDSLDEATTEAGWHKSNPSLRHNKFLMQIYRQEVVDMESDAELNIEFHCKRVNFPKEDTRFALASFGEIKDVSEGENLEAFSKRTGKTDVIGVVDFSEARDLTSCGIIMSDMLNGEYYYNHKSFITQKQYASGIIKQEVLNNATRDNRLEIVFNDQIDTNVVVNYFVKQADTYFIRVIYIDQYKSTLLKPALEMQGFTVVVIATNMKNETQVLPVIDDLFINRKLHAGKDSLFQWAISNIYKNVGSNGVKFDKIEPKARKTDPASAFIAGLIGEYCYNDNEVIDSSFAGELLT